MKKIKSIFIFSLLLALCLILLSCTPSAVIEIITAEEQHYRIYAVYNKSHEKNEYPISERFELFDNDGNIIYTEADLHNTPVIKIDGDLLYAYTPGGTGPSSAIFYDTGKNLLSTKFHMVLDHGYGKVCFINTYPETSLNPLDTSIIVCDIFDTGKYYKEYIVEDLPLESTGYAEFLSEDNIEFFAYDAKTGDSKLHAAIVLD